MQDLEQTQPPSGASSPGFADRHVLWVGALLAFVLAGIATCVDREAWDRQRWSFMSQRALDTLLDHAGVDPELSDPRDRLELALEPMGAEPAQVAGIRAAMAASPRVREVPRGPQRLLASAHSWGSIHAAQFRLVRRDWALRAPMLERFIHAPWIPGLALLVGSLCCFWGPFRWLTMPVAAGTAHAALAYTRRGSPFREVPVRWREWPDTLYEQLDEAWLQVVFHRPMVSAISAAALLFVAWVVSQRAHKRGLDWSSSQLAVAAVWALASVAWWDACLRTSLPLSWLDSDGAGWMRLSHAARGLAWGASGVMLLRRAQAGPAPSPAVDSES